MTAAPALQLEVHVAGQVERLVLLWLKLRNFKRERERDVEFRGQDLNIFGDNATGKTTHADAIMWLLFGKDSQNRKDFGIKTLDSDMKPVPMLEHEVEAAFLVRGEEITLKKVYREKWERERGAPNKTFKGHTTDHFLNGIACDEKTYKAKVDSICQESVFRLLADPTYFNTQLKWQDRRTLLLEVCGDVTDREVIDSKAALEELPRLIGNDTIEQHQQRVKGRLREINEQLEQIPIRVSEAHKAMPEAKDAEAAAGELAILKEEARQLQAEMARLINGAEIVERQKHLSQVELAILEHRKKATSEMASRMQAQQTGLSTLKNKAADAQRTARRLEGEVSDLERQLVRQTATLDGLLGEYAAIAAETFALTQTDTCPSCGQQLPAEKLQAAYDKALEEFNAARSAKAERNMRDGRDARKAVNDTQGRLAALRAQLEQAQEDQATAEALAAQEEARLRSSADVCTEPADDPVRNKLEGQREAHVAAIHELMAETNGERERITARLAEIEEQRSVLATEAASQKQRDDQLARIAELQKQEKELAAEFERLQHEVFLMEQFTRAKVDLLTEKINERFKLARFKLFHLQVNGALEETCETAVGGVPYGDLNHGARVNVGLDIINTLAQHYGFAPPVVIDNAESVTEILPTLGQQVRLIVSKPDKTLRFEKAS